MKHKIKLLLTQLGISQKELAEKTGFTEVGISKMISTGNASKTSLERISKIMDVPFETIIVDEGPILKAKYGSDKTPLKIGNLELPCYVLEDGTRVFSGRGMQKAIGSTSTSGTWLSRFVETSPIHELLDEIRTGETTSLYKMQHPLRFTRKGAGGSQLDTYGYEATLLIDLCDVIIKAGEKGYNISKQYIVNANIIIRAVAKTGIIALVDEVTGYDKAKERAKNALQQFLNQFIQEEAAKWVKTFNDQFFEDIYKMRNWTWTKTSQRPGVIGQWITDIVYDRLGPIVPKLEQLNPKNEHGNRSHKHHQFLSREIGLPKLKEHLAAVHAIAVISNYNWDKFMLNLDKAFPKKNSQLFLDLDFDE